MTPNRWGTTLLVALLLKLGFLALVTRAHPLGQGEEKCFFYERNACADEVCQCQCDLQDLPPVYEISCPAQGDKVRLYLEPRNYFRIACPTNNDDFQNMPHMKVGAVESVMIKDCKIPPTTSIVDILNRFGVSGVKRLFITNNDRHFPFRRAHFKGLHDLQRLSLNSRTLETLDDDLFAEIANITWLEIKNTRLQRVKTALSVLTHLKTFEMPTNAITELEAGAFEGVPSLERLSLYSNQLQRIGKEDFRGLTNVHTLELLANQIETIHPDAFVSLGNLTTLGLTKNRFTALPEQLFRGNAKLTEVKMLYNNISTLPVDLFANLPGLELVHLNNAGVVTVPETAFRGSANIRNITLADNQIQVLAPKTFDGLGSLLRLELQRNLIGDLPESLLDSCRRLVYLDLSYNKIVSLPGRIFSNQLNLVQLNLRNNELKTINPHVFGFAVNLRILNLAHNDLQFATTSNFVDGELPQSPLRKLINMEDLDLSHNQISHVYSDFRRVMVRLRRLDLSNNTIAAISYNDLTFHPQGIDVNLGHNRISYVNFNYFAVTTGANELPQSAPRVTLRGNPLACDCGMLEFANYLRNPAAQRYLQVDRENMVCAAPGTLKGQNLTTIDTKELTCAFRESSNQRCPSQCTCHLRPVDGALIVDCSNNRNMTEIPQLPFASLLNYNHTILNVTNCALNRLPTATSHPSYAEVRELIARGNNVSQIAAENLPPQLMAVDLSENRLVAVPPAITARFNATRFALAGNQWPCDCAMKDLLNNLQAHRHMIADYDEMRCENAMRDLISEKTVSDICPQELNLTIILLIVMSCLAIVVGLLSALYYKYQQEIKIWLYWHNVMPFLFNSDFLDSDKKYDAFISYSHQDESFVTDHLMPELEHKRRFNLCIHRRDWTPGDFIPQQIVRSVNESRRTIIVLSPSYVESVWGTMEFRAAHRAAMDDQVNRVIVVIFGQVDKEKLDPELKSYIDLNTYIEWGDPWFWERLHYALRTIQTRKKKEPAGKLEKAPIKGSVDDKLELINGSPVSSPLATPAADYPALNLNLSYKQNGHVNGAFIINTNSKQSDV